MSANLDLLKELFPGRIMLSVDEVAEVMAVGGADPSYAQTRRELKEGRIIPGLRRVGNVWKVPITALAEALDRMVDVEPAVPSTSRTRRERAALAPSARGAYGSRGRKPDALRERIEEFAATGVFRWAARPATPEPPPPPAMVFEDKDLRARLRYEHQQKRTQSFWEGVGSRLFARVLEDSMPDTAN